MNVNMEMDINATWEEIKSIFGRGKKADEGKTSVGLFGGGLHVHFHISINPTFMQREKMEGT